MQQEPHREQGDGVDSAVSGMGLSLVAEYSFVLVLFSLLRVLCEGAVMFHSVDAL